jgi:hypothetical protein
VRARVFDGKTKKLAHLYIDPYTAEVLKMDTTIYFFISPHICIPACWQGKVGGWIVAISTVIFLISSLTGLILWWPNRWNRTTRQASFTIKWKARFKRLNYDLHNVYGFYSLILCVVLSATGLIIFFHPLGDLTVKLAGGSTCPCGRESFLKLSKEKQDWIWCLLSTSFSKRNMPAKKISVSGFTDLKIGSLCIFRGTSGLKSTENMDIAVFDKYNGARIAVVHLRRSTRKWRTMCGSSTWDNGGANLVNYLPLWPV